MRELRFSVPGQPQQKRSGTPMVTVPKTRGGQTVECVHCKRKTPVNTFMTQNKQNKRNAAPIIYACRAAGWHDKSPHLGPVAVFLYCAFPYLKAWSKKRIQTAKGMPKVKMPDIDRLANQVFDSLTGEVWKDDGQVFGLFAVKAYEPAPRTVVKINLYDEDEPVEIRYDYVWPTIETEG